MPNLIVYVPAALWKELHALGLDDPKVEARKVALGALERYVTGKPLVVETDAPHKLVAAYSPELEKKRPEPPPADTFRSDPKPGKL